MSYLTQHAPVAPPFHAPAPAPADIVPIPCPRCGASMVEDVATHLHAPIVARCKFCGNSEALPPESAERIRFLRLRLLQLRNAAQMAEAPARSVEAIRKNAGIYIPCALVFGALPLLSSSTVASAEHHFDTAARDPSFGSIATMLEGLFPILIMPSIMIGIVVGYFAMIFAFNRAVRPLLSARPPVSPNGRARCRTCGGDLTVTPAPSVQCSYCNATNLLGEQLTTERAALLEREANEYRDRAQAFGETVASPFKSPANSFYVGGAVGAGVVFVVANVASVVVVLAR